MLLLTDAGWAAAPPSPDSGMIAKLKTRFGYNPRDALAVTSGGVSYTLYSNPAQPYHEAFVRAAGWDFAWHRYVNRWLGSELAFYRGTGREVTDGDLRDPSRAQHYELADVSPYEEVGVSGVRGAVMTGWHLHEPGLKLSAGLGAFLERATLDYVDGRYARETVRGFAFKVAVGYNWRAIGFDFWMSGRFDEPSGFEPGSTQGGWRLIYYLPTQ